MEKQIESQQNNVLRSNDFLGGSDKRLILMAGCGEMTHSVQEFLAENFAYLTVADAENAISAFRTHETSVSLIMIEDRQAAADNCSFLRVLNEEDHIPRIPILVLTEDQDTIDTETMLTLGVADFIEKPYRSSLIGRINNMIRLRESTAMITAMEYDELTGLYTRQAFCHHADLLLKRNPDKQYDLLISDMEDFKIVNDRYGPQIGDQILKDVADRLRPGLEDGVLVGRYSGDQFVSLMEHTPASDPDFFLGISKSVVEESPYHNLVTKFGLYLNVDHSLPASVLCDRALMALRTTKHKYGVDYAVFDEALLKKVVQQQNIELDMHTALEEEQFKVYYQPKHDARTGALIGAEALIRWIHPEYGFMNPGEFIPLFERNGFITKVDSFVWRKTCENLRRWIDMGLSVVPISVNVSKLDFQDPGFWDSLVGPVKDNRVSPEFLHIEVTESLFADNVNDLVKILKQCREAGFQVELDDFGAGYSSLNTLGTLPLDVVKLEMSFMKQIHEERRLRVLSACVNLAKSLSLRTVAEGVESTDQMKIVQNLGVDVIQGYYFSKAIPTRDFENYLVQHPVSMAAAETPEDAKKADESGVYVVNAAGEVVAFNESAAAVYPALKVGASIASVMETGGMQNPHEIGGTLVKGPHIIWNHIRNLYETVDMTRVELGTQGLCTVVNFSTVGEEATFAKKYREQELRNYNTQLIQALTSNYNDVYSLNLKNGEINILRFTGNAAGVKDKLNQGFGYKEAIDVYVAKNVYEEDREMFLEATRLPHVLEELRKNRMYTFNYRVTRGGVVKFFRAKYISIEESEKVDCLLAAFADVDKETRLLLADRTKMQEKMDIIKAFAEIFYCAYYIDIKKDTFEEISSRDTVRDIISDTDSCQKAMGMVADAKIQEAYRAGIHAFNDMSKWAESLADRDVISQRFCGISGGTSRANLIAAKRDENGTVTHVIYAIRTISTEDFKQI